MRVEALQHAKESVEKICHLLAMGCEYRTLQMNPSTGQELDLCAQVCASSMANYEKDVEYGWVCPSSRGKYRVEPGLVPRSKYDRPLEPGVVVGFCYYRKTRKAVERDYLISAKPLIE